MAVGWEPAHPNMHRQIADLAAAICDEVTSTTSTRRYIIGIAGIPGSGKSTIATPLTLAINDRLRLHGSELEAIVISLDGWHYTRATLRSMPNPDHLLRRRGAHFTFDGEGYVSFIRSLDTDSPSIPFPAFSHAEKDPKYGAGAVQKRHRIIIIEGLYCHLDTLPWKEASERCNLRIWVHTDPTTAGKRLVQRHFSEGVEDTWEKAVERVTTSDLPNGQFIIEHSLKPHATIDNDTLSESFTPPEDGPVWRTVSLPRVVEKA